jgi:hypothetical protein
MSVLGLSGLGSGWRKGWDECVGAVWSGLWVGMSVLGLSGLGSGLG